MAETQTHSLFLQIDLIAWTSLTCWKRGRQISSNSISPQRAKLYVRKGTQLSHLKAHEMLAKYASVRTGVSTGAFCTLSFCMLQAVPNSQSLHRPCTHFVSGPFRVISKPTQCMHIYNDMSRLPERKYAFVIL
jgi:hypothetical protein